jgi:four helix bundle protein
MSFELSKTFSKEETYSLTGQISWSSRSVGAQIAEALGKRSRKKHLSANVPIQMLSNWEHNNGLVMRLIVNA